VRAHTRHRERPDCLNEDTSVVNGWQSYRKERTNRERHRDVAETLENQLIPDSRANRHRSQSGVTQDTPSGSLKLQQMSQKDLGACTALLTGELGWVHLSDRRGAKQEDRQAVRHQRHRQSCAAEGHRATSLPRSV
jgi:hypothetical protein